MSFDLAAAAAASADAAAASGRPIKRKRTGDAGGGGGGGGGGMSASFFPPSSPSSSIAPPPPASASASASASAASASRLLSPLARGLEGELQDELLSVFFPDAKSHGPHMYRQLPGPQPFSMVHRDLQALASHDYWVCEKSDGERAMLFISKRRQATFVLDRKFHIQQLRHGCYAELWGHTGDTLLDGELVTPDNLPPGCRGPQATFMIFDALLLHGERLLDRRLSERLAAIGQKIVLPYRARFPQYATFPSPPAFAASQHASPSDGSDHPIAIRAKAFHRKHRLKDGILDHIRQIPGTDEWEYNDGKRRNKNDGVVFTPENDDYFCTRVRLFKWKWPGLNTIDFQVRSPWFDSEGRLMLYTNANPAPEYEGAPRLPTVTVHYRSTFLEGERRAWFLQQVEGKKSAIVEMQYSVKTSSWVPKLFRWDKSQPNFLTTVAGTLETIVDDIQPADLYAVCNRRPAIGQPMPPHQQQQQQQQQQQHSQSQSQPPPAPGSPQFPSVPTSSLGVMSQFWSSGASGVAAALPAASAAPSSAAPAAPRPPSPSLSLSPPSPPRSSTPPADVQPLFMAPPTPMLTVAPGTASATLSAFEQIASSGAQPLVETSRLFGD